MRKEAILKLVEMLGVKKAEPHATYVIIDCPFASVSHKNGEDKHPSLSILVRPNERSGFKCHSCGEKGVLSWLVTRWALLTRKDPIPLFDLIKREEEGVEAVQNRIECRVTEKWADQNTIADRVDWEVFSDEEFKPFLGRVHPSVLDKISIETCKEWGIGHDPEWRNPEDGTKWPRTIIPVRRRDGKLVGLMGRAIYDDTPNKYWNYFHFVKTNYLFGLDKLKPGFDSVIVVEGMFDVMKFWQFGLPVVGTMGALPSERQALLLQEHGRVCLALDCDKAGKEGVSWLTQRLKDRVPLFTVKFPDGKTDPKQFTKDEAWRAFENVRRIL